MPSPDATLPTEDDVRGMLAGVIDPELHASIVELDMVDRVQIDADGVVRVRIALTTAGCPLRGQIQADVASKIRGLAGVTDGIGDYGGVAPGQKTAATQPAPWDAREHAEPTEGPA